ncbi:unnamed protein product [Brachionus calyciflorus]|uniref:Selenoprotein F/M domain-containing protein n=1 Tax=Brachionus calyciflorus TaxID=104777 RepID=A0A813Q965_9BILA|nr:unnamed protein product [Brachionus calyciflorus]
MRGKEPTLVLYDENGDEVENLGIDKWTTDTVEEYLNQILGMVKDHYKEILENKKTFLDSVVMAIRDPAGYLT